MSKNSYKRRTIEEWDNIQRDFERDYNQARIRRKYDIPSGTLGDRIKKFGWKLSKEANNALYNFETASKDLNENYMIANDKQKQEINNQAMDIMARQEITANNTRLMAQAQQILLSKMSRFDEDNIKNLTGAIKDIESVSNPQAKTAIQINSPVDNNLDIKFIEIDDMI